MSVTVVLLLSLAILVVGFLAGWLVGGLATGLSAIALIALPVLVIGFLVGWLVEWIIDNQHRRIRELGHATTAGSTPVPDSAEHEVTELVGAMKQVLGEREKQINDLRTELEQQDATIERLKNEFDAYQATHPDDLTVIKGIGRIYQWKLRDAGINTYKALATLKPERLREILQFKPWQNADPASWIDQARTLAGKD